MLVFACSNCKIYARRHQQLLAVEKFGNERDQVKHSRADAQSCSNLGRHHAEKGRCVQREMVWENYGHPLKRAAKSMLISLLQTEKFCFFKFVMVLSALLCGFYTNVSH